MMSGKVINTSCQTANRSLPNQPVQRNVNRVPAANIEKISRNENGALPPFADCRNDLGINGLG